MADQVLTVLVNTVDVTVDVDAITIGPIVSAQTGIRTVDVGVPQLSMHSVREMMGTEDVDICHKHFLAFYENIAKVDANVQMSS